MEQPNLEFAFEINIQVARGKMLEAGETGKGCRRIVPITGGTFDGPSIKGTVIAGGYDWQLLRRDGVLEIDARYVLKTNDDALITIVNKGLRHGPAEVLARMANGEEVRPEEYYFRSVPFFETGHKKYEWLAKSIFIATGVRKPSNVLIRVWKVL